MSLQFVFSLRCELHKVLHRVAMPKVRWRVPESWRAVC